MKTFTDEELEKLLARRPKPRLISENEIIQLSKKPNAKIDTLHTIRDLRIELSNETDERKRMQLHIKISENLLKYNCLKNPGKYNKKCKKVKYKNL